MVEKADRHTEREREKKRSDMKKEKQDEEEMKKSQSDNSKQNRDVHVTCDGSRDAAVSGGFARAHKYRVPALSHAKSHMLLA